MLGGGWRWSTGGHWLLALIEELSDENLLFQTKPTCCHEARSKEETEVTRQCRRGSNVTNPGSGSQTTSAGRVPMPPRLPPLSQHGQHMALLQLKGPRLRRGQLCPSIHLVNTSPPSSKLSYYVFHIYIFADNFIVRHIFLCPHWGTTLQSSCLRVMIVLIFEKWASERRSKIKLVRMLPCLPRPLTSPRLQLCIGQRLCQDLWFCLGLRLIYYAQACNYAKFINKQPSIATSPRRAAKYNFTMAPCPLPQV